MYTGTPEGCLPLYIIKSLDVCGLRGDHVTGMISSRGESIAGWGFILWRGSCDLDQTGCHEDHVMCLSIADRVLFSHVLLYTQESHGKSILP